MNSQINTNQCETGHELTIWSVIDFLCKSWRWVAVGAALGVVCSLTFLAVTPKQYEALALFQGAKILGSDLETVPQLVERLKFPTFYTKEQVATCGLNTLSDESNGSWTLSKSISLVAMKGTNVLQVGYRAPSKALAVQCLESIMGLLSASQNNLADTVLLNARNQLEMTRSQLSEAQKLQSMVSKRSQAGMNIGDVKVEKMLLLSSALAKIGEGSGKSILEQMALLEAPATRQAGLIEPIFASNEPVFPKRLPVVLGGVCAGMALGILAFLMRRSWLRTRFVN